MKKGKIEKEENLKEKEERLKIKGKINAKGENTQQGCTRSKFWRIPGGEKNIFGRESGGIWFSDRYKDPWVQISPQIPNHFLM
jgi:hypothetical protein